MKVTAIKFLKNSYELTIEPVNEKYRITADLLLELRLINNREITSQEYKIIKDAGIRFKLLNKILNKINFRIRSTHEVKTILLEEKADKDTIIYILEHLTKNKYLDDKLFKKLFISDTINLTDKGPNFIIDKLDRHKIEYSDDDLINIYELENERIHKIIIKKTRNIKGSKYQIKQKIVSHLVQRGYSYAKIQEQIKDLQYSEYNSLEKDYMKIKSKNTEKKKIIQKLQAKGYKYENIKFIMEEKNENS